MATGYLIEQWWLRALGRTLVWARLRVTAAGPALVFDCDGRTLSYDSEDSARAALLDAEFQALDGLDDEDAAVLGVDLRTLRTPAGSDEDQLREAMIQSLPRTQ